MSDEVEAIEIAMRDKGLHLGITELPDGTFEATAIFDGEPSFRAGPDPTRIGDTRLQAATRLWNEVNGA